MTGEFRVKRPRSELTLSAVADLDPDDDRITAAIERHLRRIDRARRRGRRIVARRLERELERFVWGPIL